MTEANQLTPPSSLGSAAKPKSTTVASRSNASSRTYLLFVLTCIFVTMTGNFLHHRIADPHTLHRRSMDSFKAELEGHNELHKKLLTEKKSTSGNNNNNTGTSSSSSPIGHNLAGLSCIDHNGPYDNELASEMVYWEDIPSDSQFTSPLLKRQHSTSINNKKKYLTFEPDGGGFNNIRMSLETIVVMAHAMGRILVMPPSQNHYLLRKDRDRQRTHFSFNDFYHFERIGYEHDGLQIITMKQFLEEEGLKGHLFRKEDGTVSYPPYNRTDWDGYDLKELKEYLRNVTLTPLDWSPGSCLAAFPSDEGMEHFEELKNMMEEIKNGEKKKFPSPNEFDGNPVAVDAEPVERLREAVAGQVKRLCIYDKEMQDAMVVHFMCYHKMRVRMLTHFYAFLFFEDWRHDLWSKRFVRDHLRYSDEIQCAAARVVAALRERARKKDPKGNPEGEFDSMHIRRGDFQYKETQITADQIYENSKNEMKQGGVVFIATDHQNKQFFKPLADKYDLVFLKDFKKELEGVNTNYYGMIDQLVASRGRVFFGCYRSTFTGFIIRMRAYHAMRDEAPGWEDGSVYNTFFYTGQREKKTYEKYFSLSPPYFTKEFPTAWRQINAGITELESLSKA